MRTRWLLLVAVGGLLALGIAGCTSFGPASVDPTASDPARTIEVVVSGELTDAVLADLGGYGTVTDTYPQIGGVTMDVRASALATIEALPYVAVVGDRAERHAYGYSGGVSTWDLDIINITNPVSSRVVGETGEGVYVAVLDTGLVGNWRDYLPAEQVAVAYGRAFSGGGNENANISDPTHAWERDTEGHGTHVASTVLGYAMPTRTVNGAAPLATVIPVKVLHNNGSGWSTIIAHGILYVADLKGELGAPIVINMSLGGSVLSPLEAAAIDYAIEKGVIIVASAGNEGEQGMGYPGAYEPVISVGSAGWTGEWVGGGAWWRADVADPTAVGDVYVSDFSSRETAGQDLDVLAPGSWVVGPYLGNGASHPPFWSHSQNGQYYFLGGTSMASPHVAGLVALMLERNPGLTAAQAEAILESTALGIPAGSAVVNNGNGQLQTFSWGADATGSGLVQADAALAAVP